MELAPFMLSEISNFTKTWNTYFDSYVQSAGRVGGNESGVGIC